MSRRTITSELTVEHEEIRRLFVAVDQCPERDGRRRELAGRLRCCLSRHFAAEAAYLHQAVRNYVAEGDAVAAADMSGQHTIARGLQALERCGPGHARFRRLLGALRRAA